MATANVTAPATVGAAGGIYAGSALAGQVVAQRRADLLAEALDDLRAAIVARDTWGVWEKAGSVCYLQGLAAADTTEGAPMGREVAHELARALALLLRRQP